MQKVDISPIMLKTQVYSIVKDRTDVDRELEVRLQLGLKEHLEGRCFVTAGGARLLNIGPLASNIGFCMTLS